MFIRLLNTVLFVTISLASARVSATSVELLGAKIDTPSDLTSSTSEHEFPIPAQLPSSFIGPGRVSKALEALKPEEKLLTRGAREAAIYAEKSPSVVLVVTEEGFGSGSLISASGDILTNWHVVGDAREVGIIFKPTKEGEALTPQDLWRAEVIKIDQTSDLALVRVATVPEGRVPIPLGDLNNVVVGGDVHAIGHPTGEAWTYTRGFVSQIRRAYEWRTESMLAHKADVIQTQTPINPGNSGGPLLSDTGTLVGVNSFKSAGESLNFAVAVDEVREFLDRPGDRLADKPAQIASQTAADCEPALLGEEGTTLDGTPGTLGWMDVTCDGEADFQVFVPDDETLAFAFYFDSTGDGKVDIVMFDLDRDGEVDQSFYDTNGDGEEDLVGYFRNGEAEPYRIERLGSS